jgi:hypothetical protein
MYIYRYRVQYQVQYRVIPDIGVDPLSGIPILVPATPYIGVNIFTAAAGIPQGFTNVMMRSF